MAEPTLSIALTELQRRVGSFLGWGSDPTAYDAEQLFELQGFIASGLRRFYYPEPMDGSTVSYDWSFLKPVATFALASGTSTILMPADFGGIDGLVSVLATATVSQPWNVDYRNEGLIRQMFSGQPTMTGPPMYVAQQPLKGVGTQDGQHFQLLFFPAADQGYQVQVPYYVNPDYLTTAQPYALGGSQHSETILEACLSVAEKRHDDQATVHDMEFKRRLLASISLDRKNKPQKIGYNRDRSDEVGRFRPHGFVPAGTYNGAALG